MIKTLAFIIIGLGIVVAGGCIFADGFTSPRPVTLSVPSDDLSVRTEWEGESRVLHVSSNRTFRFETPYLRSGTTYWLGFIPHHYIHGENAPFLFVTKDENEWRTLTPREIWNLPRDESGTSILRER
jgi:hypothetical protein